MELPYLYGFEIVQAVFKKESSSVKKLLLKLSLLPVLALALSLSTPNTSDAQTVKTCPSGSFECTCNGIRSCQSSVEGCWNSC